MSEPLPTHVYAIDDDPLVLQFVQAALEGIGLQVRGYPSGEAFFAAADRADVGCIIIDLHLPGISGREIQQRLQQAGSDLAVIVVSGKANVATAVQVMQNGAVTLLEKPYTVEALRGAVQQGLKLSREAHHRRRQAREIRSRLDQLSHDERQVLEGMLAGETNKLLAQRLVLSARTIERHKSSVLKKMQVGSAAELASLMAVSGEW
jgi:two-component system, LuxR family, response regulator FixJ